MPEKPRDLVQREATRAEARPTRRESLEAEAEALRCAFGSRDASAVDIRSLCQYLSRERGYIFRENVDLGVNAYGQDVLGRASLSTKTVFISSSLTADESRWRFTIAHEIGYLLLHSALSRLVGSDHIDARVDYERLQDSKKANGFQRMEWQANVFASCLLMPRKSVQDLVFEHQKNRGVDRFPFAAVFVDNQRGNRHIFFSFIRLLSAHFRVSKAAAEYRLKDLGLLVDKRRG